MIATRHLVFLLLALLMVSSSASANDFVKNVTVKVQTSNASLAGTDNDVFLRLVVRIKGSTQIIEQELDIGNVDNFEQGQEDNFTFPAPPFLKPCDISAIAIRKSEDDSNGGWRLAWFQIFLDGQLFRTENVGEWLEDDHLEWSANDFQPVMCPPPPVPPEIKIEQIPFPPCTVAVEVDNNDPEFPKKIVEKPDKDCDETPDDVDKDFSPPDPDGDGIPTPLEDLNHNGKVDEGETDPAKSDAENLLDSDGDNLADIFEDALGTDKNNPDTDDDGWFDGPANVRTQVFLLSVECINSQEDVELGYDEIFITANHSRWPEGKNLSGVWKLTDGQSAGQLLEIARRTRGIGQGAAFSVRIDLLEEDVFDFSDDELFLNRDLAFTENQTFFTEYLDDGFFNTVHYKLHFVAISGWFSDPTPTSKEADADKDGLNEKTEFEVGSALAGMADPVQPDIYVELDSAVNQVPERYSKEDISSLFAYRGYAFHLDDGVFGGGQVLFSIGEVDYGEAQAVRKSNFDKASRCGIFRYVLAVNEFAGDEFGKSDKPTKDKAGKTICGSGFIVVFETDFLDHLTDFESIVWIHELGHTLGLCHPPVDGPGANECSSCMIKEGSCACTRPDGSDAEGCNCTHYMVDDSSDTAMGTGNPPPWIIGTINAIDREPMYDEAEWKAIDLTSISSKGPVFGCP
jgi:hypothetical protein